MAAMTLATMAVCRSGDRILMPETLYGPARDMILRFLGPLGIAAQSYDPRNREKSASAKPGFSFK
jgi:cystathionine beta-lyase